MDNHENLQSQSTEDSMPWDEFTTEHNKKGRGTAILKNLSKMSTDERCEVLYNKFGQAIGSTRVDFSSYKGLLARSMVPISYSSWHKVPNSFKENLWTAVKVSK